MWWKHIIKQSPGSSISKPFRKLGVKPKTYCTPDHVYLTKHLKAENALTNMSNDCFWLGGYLAYTCVDVPKPQRVYFVQTTIILFSRLCREKSLQYTYPFIDQSGCGYKRRVSIVEVSF